MTKLKANKKFILSNGGIIEYRTYLGSKGYYRGIYLLRGEMKYQVHPRTFTSITSNLKKIKSKEYDEIVSTLYNVI
mgnify:FL=1